MPNRPAILDEYDVDTLDTLAGDQPAARVAATRLREGMVLLDPDLGCPAVWLDHRQRATPRSGEVRWLAHDLDTGRLTTVAVHRRTTLAVLATA